MARGEDVGSILTAVVAVLVLIGCGINDLGDKYSRYSHPPTCSKGVLALNMESSEFCCDEPLHQTEWVCLAAYDFANSIMTSIHAFYIPLIPSILTFIVDVLCFESGSTKKSSAGAMIEGRTSRLTWGGNLALRLKDLIEKLKLNVGIILYRTVSNHNMHITFVHTTDFERSCSLSSPTVKLVIFPFISLVSIFCT